MAHLVTLRNRRSAGELHALQVVEREIRATDPKLRRKYLRDFNGAFREYQSVLSPGQLDTILRRVDVLLIGDYHALARSQRFAAGLIDQLADDRPLVLGLEMVFARDQHILDEWLRGEIEEQELRRRLRFDTDWGYDWPAIYELLMTARRHGARVCGLDLGPRFDMRRIGARDRHASAAIAALRERQPEVRVLVLFGESHLAPDHIPALLRARRPADRIVTVLQNIDPLYWQAAAEKDRVEAVKVREDVVCVFNATPLEKYESYRRWIERWRREPGDAADIAPTIYNLLDALLRFLNVSKYLPIRERGGCVADLLPEVHAHPHPDALRKLLARRGTSEREIKRIAEHAGEYGSCYVPAHNSIYTLEFEMVHGAEEVAHFVHRVCRGAAEAESAPSDLFYTRVLEEALAYFGSRVLYPARPPVREADLYALYAQLQQGVEQQSGFLYAEYMQMLDFLVLHKDFEANQRQYWQPPLLLDIGVAFAGEKFDFVTLRLGYMLGTELYDAYIQGRVTKRLIRALFFRALGKPGVPRQTYFDIVQRIRKPQRRQLAA